MRKMDEATRNLLKNSDVFTDALCFFLRKHGFPDAQVTTTEADPVASARGRMRTADVAMWVDIVSEGRQIRALVLIENQTHVRYDMPLRTQFDSTLHTYLQRNRIRENHRINGTLPKGSVSYLSGLAREDRLPPVLVIVIHYGLEPWDGALSLSAIVEPHANLADMLSDTPLNLLSFADLSPDELDSFMTNDLRALAKSIRYGKMPEKFKEEVHTDPAFLNLREEVLQIVQYVTHIDLSKTIKKEGNDMKKEMSEFEKYFSQKAREKGWQEGKLEGWQEGKLEGKQEGREEEKADTIIRMANRKFSFDDIVNATNSTPQQVREIAQAHNLVIA